MDLNYSNPDQGLDPATIAALNRNDALVSAQHDADDDLPSEDFGSEGADDGEYLGLLSESSASTDVRFLDHLAEADYRTLALVSADGREEFHGEDHIFLGEFLAQ